MIWRRSLIDRGSLGSTSTRLFFYGLVSGLSTDRHPLLKFSELESLSPDFGGVDGPLKDFINPLSILRRQTDTAIAKWVL